MRIAAVAGLLFYVGMLTVHTPALLLALQLPNDIGILAGFRHALLPGSDANRQALPPPFILIPPAWAGLLQVSLAGVVAEIWNYHTVFWIALVMRPTLSCLTRD